MAAQRRDGLSFADKVAAGASGELTRELTKPGTIESVEVRIYQGAQTTLELELYLLTSSESRRPIVELIGKDVIDGDDDVYRWEPSHPFEKEDTIVVKHNNTDGANPHRYRVNMDVDYRGPMERLAKALRGAF